MPRNGGELYTKEQTRYQALTALFSHALGADGHDDGDDPQEGERARQGQSRGVPRVALAGKQVAVCLELEVQVAQVAACDEKRQVRKRAIRLRLHP